MSTYCTIGGLIHYEKEEDFQAALAILKEGWLDDEGYMLTEDEHRIDEVEPSVDAVERDIFIPLFHYRNLGYVLNDLFKGGKGKVIWTCTDGCFEGGVIVDGKETHYDLEKWAAEGENMEFEEDRTPPDVEKEFDDYCEWQGEVEQAFFEMMGD